jgi:hypothetical protein
MDFYHLCDQIPVVNNLKEEKFIFLMVSEVQYIMEGRVWWSSSHHGRQKAEQKRKGPETEPRKAYLQ